MNAGRVVLGAWVAAMGLTMVRSLTDPTAPALPKPSAFLGTGVLFTMLYGASSFVGPLAATLAVGVDVGMVARPYLAGSSSPPLTNLAAFLGHLDGTGSSSSGAGTPASGPGGQGDLAP